MNNYDIEMLIPIRVSADGVDVADAIHRAKVQANTNGGSLNVILKYDGKNMSGTILSTQRVG